MRFYFFQFDFSIPLLHQKECKKNPYVFMPHKDSHPSTFPLQNYYNVYLEKWNVKLVLSMIYSLFTNAFW